MTEERYKSCKIIVLIIFVGGFLGISGRISNDIKQLAENGRYVQYDIRKDSSTIGNATTTIPTRVIDTRTGSIREAGKINP
jgi:hypothetical protein